MQLCCGSRVNVKIICRSWFSSPITHRSQEWNSGYQAWWQAPSLWAILPALQFLKSYLASLESNSHASPHPCRCCKVEVKGTLAKMLPEDSSVLTERFRTFSFNSSDGLRLGPLLHLLLGLFIGLRCAVRVILAPFPDKSNWANPQGYHVLWKPRLHAPRYLLLQGPGSSHHVCSSGLQRAPRQSWAALCRAFLCLLGVLSLPWRLWHWGRQRAGL